MKSFGVGCIGVVLGLFGGSLLALGAFQLQAGGSPLYAAPSNAQADVSITVSVEYINSQLQPAVQQSGLAQKMILSFAAPNILQVATTIDTNVFGFPVSVDVTVPIRVTVQAGRIVLTVDRVDAGGVPIPQALLGSEVERMRALAEDQFNREAQRALQGTGLQIVNVRMTSDTLTIDLVSQ
jgi:hypothetical protein